MVNKQVQFKLIPDGDLASPLVNHCVKSDGSRYIVNQYSLWEIPMEYHRAVGIVDPATSIVLTEENITELHIIEGVINVFCHNNKLTKLDIPSSVKRLYCMGNEITELIVPDNCVVDCDPGCVVITQTMYCEAISHREYNRSKLLKNILK